MGQFVFTDIKNLHGFPHIKMILENKFGSVVRELEGSYTFYVTATVYGKTFEWENFRGFRSFSPNHECFTTNS